MKELSLNVSLLGNRIYLGKQLKDGSLAESRVDMTEQCVEAVTQVMKTNYKRGKGAFIIEGAGHLKFTPEGNEVENQQLRLALTEIINLSSCANGNTAIQLANLHELAKKAIQGTYIPEN